MNFKDQTEQKVNPAPDDDNHFLCNMTEKEEETVMTNRKTMNPF